MNSFLKDVPLKSIVHLFLVRGSIYLFPFITLPIITKALGVSQFGVLSVFLAAQQYLVMLVEYGFTLTGSRDIARAVDREDEEKIVSEIVICRVAIFVLSAISILVIYIVLPASPYSICYIILLFSVFSSIFNQTHFFIGKENTGFIVISSSISRVLSIFMVVFFVKSESDLNIAMLAYSINVALPNILSSIYLSLNFKYNLFKVRALSFILSRFKSGFDIFISNVFTNIYSSLTLIYLGTAKGTTETGYYSGADKLKSAAQGVLSPVAQAFFPRIAKTKGKDFFKIWKKATFILALFSIFIVLGLIVFNQQIYSLFLGETFYPGLPVYFVLIFSIISISFGISFAQNLYLISGNTKILRMIYFFVSILHLMHMPLLVHFYGALGAAISVLITETLASLLMFCFRRRCYTWNKN